MEHYYSTYYVGQLKVVINQSAKHYNLPFVSATLRLIDDIKKYNKIDGLNDKNIFRISLMEWRDTKGI